LQAAFATAVTTSETAAESGLQSMGLNAHSGAIASRFAAYRRNVRAGIIGTLEARFPVVSRLTGEEFFRAMALVYATASPPRSPVLIEYGGGFPDFIAGFGPAADVPYLTDVARLEWLQHEAYHAADAVPLTSADLVGIAPDEVATTRFRLHPSLRLLSSPFPVLAIWTTNARDAEVQPVEFSTGGDRLLIIRPDLEVVIRRLPPAALAFLHCLQGGAAFGVAVDAAVTADPHADVQRLLANVITAGALSGYDAGR
jgi:hypothetical protein